MGTGGREQEVKFKKDVLKVWANSFITYLSKLRAKGKPEMQIIKRSSNVLI